MSYEDLIHNYEAIVNKFGRDELAGVLRTYQKTGARYGLNYPSKYKELVDFVNQPKFIEFIKEMQNYTTNPSWFDLLSIFLVAIPRRRTKAIGGYRSLGLSDRFIDVLFYPSGRPRVDFKPYLDGLHVEPKFQTIEPYEYVLQPSTVLPLTVADPPDGILLNVYMPVGRYQVGMAGFLTVAGDDDDDKDKTWCGTFYYYEPNSPFILYGPRVLVSWNKITACLDLGMDFEEVYRILYESRYYWVVGDTYDDSRDGFPNYMGFNVEGTTREEQWRNVVKGYQSRTLDPTKHTRHMYAGEDGYDQYLCELARDNGIDIVILKYMTGETRVVTEILDTRSRVSAFENIIFPPLPA